MITTITALPDNRLSITSELYTFVCAAHEINRYHSGIWNSNVLCFVPQPPPAFSDGVPVDSYEQVYDDHTRIYYDQCVVCNVPTNGNRYCGASCERLDVEGEQLWHV